MMCHLTCLREDVMISQNPEWERGGWLQDGPCRQRCGLLYLLAIKNKAANHPNLIESLLGINYMVNGTLKAIRENWT